MFIALFVDNSPQKISVIYSSKKLLKSQKRDLKSLFKNTIRHRSTTPYLGIWSFNSFIYWFKQELLVEK